MPRITRSSKLNTQNTANTKQLQIVKTQGPSENCSSSFFKNLPKACIKVSTNKSCAKKATDSSELSFLSDSFETKSNENNLTNKKATLTRTRKEKTNKDNIIAELKSEAKIETKIDLDIKIEATDKKLEKIKIKANTKTRKKSRTRTKTKTNTRITKPKIKSGKNLKSKLNVINKLVEQRNTKQKSSADCDCILDNNCNELKTQIQSKTEEKNCHFQALKNNMSSSTKRARVCVQFNYPLSKIIERWYYGERKPPVEIASKIRKYYGLPMVPKKISDFVWRLKGTRNKGLKIIPEILNQMNINSMENFFEKNEAGSIHSLVCYSPACHKILKSYNDVLMIHNSSNNNFRWPLIDIISRTKCGKTFSIAFGMVLKENYTSYSFIIKNIRNLFISSNVSFPKIVISNNEPSLKAAIARFFPDSCYYVCPCYIMEETKQVSTYLFSGTFYSLKDFIYTWQNLVNSPNAEIAWNIWEEMKNYYKECSIISYLEEVWIPYIPPFANGHSETKMCLMQSVTGYISGTNHLCDQNEIKTAYCTNHLCDQNEFKTASGELMVENIQEHFNQKCAVVKKQHGEILADLDPPKIKTIFTNESYIKDILFDYDLLQILYHEAIYMTISIASKFIWGDVTTPVEKCACNYTLLMGLPCVHMLFFKYKSNQKLRKEDFHEVWFAEANKISILMVTESSNLFVDNMNLSLSKDEDKILDDHLLSSHKYSEFPELPKFPLYDQSYFNTSFPSTSLTSSSSSSSDSHSFSELSDSFEILQISPPESQEILKPDFIETNQSDYVHMPFIDGYQKKYSETEILDGVQSSNNININSQISDLFPISHTLPILNDELIFPSSPISQVEFSNKINVDEEHDFEFDSENVFDSIKQTV